MGGAILALGTGTGNGPRGLDCACEPTPSLAATAVRSVVAILFMASLLFPGWRWRNNRMVGYQGARSPAMSQRESPLKGGRTETGLLIAPLRWATAVSTVMTMSSWSMTAAEVTRPLSEEAMSIIRVSPRAPHKSIILSPIWPQ